MPDAVDSFTCELSYKLSSIHNSPSAHTFCRSHRELVIGYEQQVTPTIDKQRQFLVISRMVQTGFLIFSVAASSENEVVPSYIIVI